MAGGMDLGGPGKGKKRALDTAINLVPFIDLMAVTISFLIMTAVWNQLGRLEVSQSGGSPDSSPPAEQTALPLNLLVTERGFVLSAGAGSVELPKVDGRFVLCHAGASDRIDGRCEARSLVGTLLKLKSQAPQQQSITVQCEDGIKYQDLVRVIDACNLKDASGRPVLFPLVAISAIG